MFFCHIIAPHITESHSLGIEEVRWFNIDESKHICKLCDGGNIEYEVHVFVTCTVLCMKRLDLLIK